jgi:hypothetical protein
MDLKDFLKDFNMANLQRYTSAQAVKDFDHFLDALPINVGYNALIAAGLTCLMGATSVWFSAQQLENVGKLHTELTNVQALQPPVPVLKYVPVSAAVLKPLADKILANFKGIKIEAGEGTVKVSAPDTDYFPQFLAAISYLQRGGRNWKVQTQALCVGRDCKSNDRMFAEFKVEMVTFSAPAIKAATADAPETKPAK